MIQKFSYLWKYNENIGYREDVDIAQRLNKIGKSHFFIDLIVYESPRRYRKGYLKLGWQVFKTCIYQLLFKKNLYSRWERID